MRSTYNYVRFLLTRLHVDSLLDKDTKKKVRSALEELSKGSEALSQAYDGAIRELRANYLGIRREQRAFFPGLPTR